MGHLKNYFFDTESIGFFSPTVLIQYAIDEGEPIIHDIFNETVHSTVSLIEDMVNNNVIGFNLAHDWFHISRTYGVFKELPQSKPPKVLDIYDLEKESICHDKYCLKPKGALDLMLYGRKNEFQATMNQKPIVIRKVPRVLAEILVEELEQRVDIPSLYFAKRQGKQNWVIKDLWLGTGKEITPEERNNPEKFNLQIDPDFVNIKLDFYPSTGLKEICQYVLGTNVDKIDNMKPFKRPTEYSWWPCSGNWLDVANEHIWGWSNDERRREYARNDVVLTRDLFKHFGSPYKEIGSYDSMLACMVGGLHWKGYEIDVDEAKKQYEEQIKIVDKCREEVQFTAPKKVVAYLQDVANPIEKLSITDSTENTLLNLVKNGSNDVAQRAQLVLDGRHANSKVNLLEKLILAGKLYVTFKVTGTKSNRMSGGSMEDGSIKQSKSGSINPQGIKKSKGEGGIRVIFKLAPEDMCLDNGDFDGYEVSIAEAVYNDENLRKDLLLGKSMHALWGAFMYGKDYDYIKSTDGIPDNEPDGYYGRSKKSFFAKLYDAQVLKLANVLQLPEEDVWRGIKYFEERYPGVARAREKIYSDFSALSQPDGIGTAIIWQEPKEYVESFLGFRRYFSLEFKVVKALYNLAQEPTEEMKKVGRLIKVKRRDRLQTGSGALQSAIYAAAFNLQSSVIRAAMNHIIQSPGGEMTKILQSRVWDLQPSGIDRWYVMPFNVHDELECPVHPSKQKQLKETITNFIEEYKQYVPLLGMKWKQNLKSWGDK